MEETEKEKSFLFKRKKKDSLKSFTIKIHGKAISRDEPELDHVKTFDDFVNQLFTEYKNKLTTEFENVIELSYLKKDAKNRLKDPYLRNFQFDSVTKDVQA